MYRTTIVHIFLFVAVFFTTLTYAGDKHGPGIPILVYHNFDPVKTGIMTISTQRFEEQLQWLKNNGYAVIPLKQAVAYLRGKTKSVPSKSVVISIDDGRESVYTYAWPLIKKYNVPVTLFIYPMVISHASYALTWEQLNELKKTGSFDIQAHTYWHPNFKEEKKHLSQSGYEKLVYEQLFVSKEMLEKKLGTSVNLLAWPFGIYDNYLKDQAAKAGYEMAFSIDGHPANRSWPLFSMPRFMIVQGLRMATFEGEIRHGVLQ